MNLLKKLADKFFGAMEKEAVFWVKDQDTTDKDLDDLYNSLIERIPILFIKKVKSLELLEIRKFLPPIKSYPTNRGMDFPILELRFQDPDLNIFRIVFLQNKNDIYEFLNEF